MNTINKKKLSYMPLNLFLSLPMFGLSMIVLTFVFKIDLVPTIIVSIAELIFDAHNHTETDYLQFQIDELKKEKNEKND